MPRLPLLFCALWPGTEIRNSCSPAYVLILLNIKSLDFFFFFFFQVGSQQNITNLLVRSPLLVWQFIKKYSSFIDHDGS